MAVVPSGTVRDTYTKGDITVEAVYNSFSLGPLVAYVLARENEIKTVRIILTGKRSGLPEEFIRERAREMYV